MTNLAAPVANRWGVPFLSCRGFASLMMWAAYESTVRSILEASIDHRKLLEILFLDDNADDADIRTMCVVPADCRDSFLRLAIVLGFLRFSESALKASTSAWNASSV